MFVCAMQSLLAYAECEMLLLHIITIMISFIHLTDNKYIFENLAHLFISKICSFRSASILPGLIKILIIQFNCHKLSN